MKAYKAILHFLNKGPELNPQLHYPKVPVMELKQFKDSCTPEERQNHGRVACALIGETFEPSDV